MKGEGLCWVRVLLCLLVLCVWVGEGRTVGIPDEDWGYVTVRPGAHMFWWLYGAKQANQRETLPLVMWLQGGPGGSSTGFGNFEEIGPLDDNLQPRNYSWIEAANVIFVDNPVGTGYSYVDDNSLLTTNETQIANDLVTLLKAFFNKYPTFQTIPFFVFSESYGGKMTASFGQGLFDAINKGQIKCNFGGVALGDSWIDPISFVLTWGPYLYSTAEIDSVGLKKIQAIANATLDAVNKKQWSRATDLWGEVEQVVEDVSFDVNFYNILQRGPGDNQYKSAQNSASARRRDYHLSVLNKGLKGDLNALMNGPIKKKLGIPANVTWGGQSQLVFQYLSVDFMQSVISTVDYLLTQKVPVVIYSGNLDLICCTIGTLQWLNQSTWAGYPSWLAARRTALNVNSEVVAFEKTFQNLRFFTILAAGHMVPADQPETALAMLKAVIYKQ